MVMTPGVFVPDRDRSFYLLARHRQPIARNVAAEYIEALSQPGDLVIDPFAASPATARAALELGRRVIAVDSNPLVAFAARLQTATPPAREIVNALAALGKVRREGETLREHIVEQYETTCANCGGRATADYFIWASEFKLPVEKAYHCAICGSRRDPTTEADRSRAAEYKPHSFQYHLLLERLGASEGPRSGALREALAHYTPRNLYVLVTVTLKLDAEFKEGPIRAALLGCLLHALDVGSNLYPAPDAQPEHKTPERFVELNLWTALEQAAETLGQVEAPLALARTPQQVAAAREPAAYIGHGSARVLAANLGREAALVLSSPARLDPLFWQLSYLWTRWLFGKTAARPLEPLLDEERGRWSWYGGALENSLKDAAALLRPGASFAAAFPAGSHAMVEALVAAAAPVFALEALTFRPERGATASTEFGALRGDYRLVWKQAETAADAVAARQLSARIRAGALGGAKRVLAGRAEPLAYSWLHHGALEALAKDGTLALLPAAVLGPRDNPLLFLRHELEAGLKEGYAHDLDHWRDATRVLWTSQTAFAAAPLAERVDAAVSEILKPAGGNAIAGGVSARELEDRVLAGLPGLVTPEIELVEKCAASYADRDEGEWRVRALDGGAERARARARMTELAARLGYRAEAGEGPYDLVWSEEKLIPGSTGGGLAELRVHEETHVVLCGPRVRLRALVAAPVTPLRGLVFLPESQVEWVQEQLRRQPRLAEQLGAAGWDFLREQFLDHMLGEAELTRAEFHLALGVEPALARGKEQLELF